MIDLNILDNEIERLEADDMNYQTCSRLADLYSVRDHYRPIYSKYSYSQSEFLQACGTAPYEAVLNVLDEHMQCINALYPKEYSAIIRKIKEASH